ncbi:purine transport regulator [Agrilactobacillus composti DSM 18527 = JCM 14202]|uniref:Purine transport regulator n=1 Tax=Agrilactobacillus composti DSM 18527 = JCM 14202 TaxID=1423734 RepID=X0PRB0_9LACO|nr:PucR family transcriptional regulator [Agrilactobacillus composti]KRM33276.1 purine transport regulator [Agrilactobacillus composti DSM 18527 = JCM 14202]GAF40352.1 hypothetical protein JCM14202_2248 [Agrilactobacillus composti DSM 18527 = JCM 14202]
MEMAQMLQAPELAAIQVIAGGAGLTREVSAIGMIEAPDIEAYLMPGQLLVTTGYHYYQDLKRLKNLIEKMAATGCAGLGIKANRYFTQVPPEIIQLADGLDFPLLLTPAQEFLSQTVKALTEVVIQSDAFTLSRVLDQNQTLSQLALNNSKYDTVLAQCASFLGSDVLLLDSHFRIRYTNPALKNQQQAITAALRLHSQVNYLTLTTSTTIPCLGRQLTIYPLMVMYGENKSFFGVFDAGQPNATKQLQLQQIQSTLSLMNSRTDVMHESAAHQQAEFFSHMLGGGLPQDMLQEQLQHYDLALNQVVFTSICGVKAVDPGALLSTRQVEHLSRLVTWFISEYALKITSFTHQQQVVLIIQASENPQHVLKTLAQFLQTKIDPRFQLKIGVSHAKLALAQLGNLYAEAKEAYTLAEQSATTIQRFRPKEVSELLHLIPANEAQTFVAELLQPLLQMKNQSEAQDLQHTLWLYLYHHQQINKVAQELYIHRNTVVYRLKKLQQLLAIDLQDPEVTQRLFIALLLLDQR